MKFAKNLFSKNTLRYGNVFKPFRIGIKYILAFIYPAIIRFYRLPCVTSIDETLDKLLSEKVSIARFGDGEFLYIIDKMNLPFQKFDPKLANMLKVSLISDNSNTLIGLPIGYQCLDEVKFKSQIMWKSHIVWTYPRIRKILNLKKVYYNSSFTRFYITIKEKSKSSRYLEKIKKLWHEEDILIIEGEKSRLGVGNDLFNNANSIERILGPTHNAFSEFDNLYQAAMDCGKEKLILLALGPTATVLAFELAKSGYWAIDIGNVDLEYEWFLANAKHKTRVKGKYNSEVKGGRIVEEIHNLDYEKEIIYKFVD